MIVDPVPSYFMLEGARLAALLKPVAPTKNLVSITVSPKVRLLYVHRVSVGFFRWYMPKRKVELLEDIKVPNDFIHLKYATKNGKNKCQIVKQSGDILEEVRQLIAG